MSHATLLAPQLILSANWKSVIEERSRIRTNLVVTRITVSSIATRTLPDYTWLRVHRLAGGPGRSGEGAGSSSPCENP